MAELDRVTLWRSVILVEVLRKEADDKGRKIVGIDLAQATWRSPCARLAKADQRPAPSVQWSTGLRAPRLRMVIEAIGGMQLPLVGALVAAGLKMVAMNPRDFEGTW